jgi:hypothetical protein
MASNAPGRRRREPRSPSNTAVLASTPNSDDAAEQQRRRDKKRVQNRLSQQSCREKQASYVRQLEHFVENMQASGMGGVAASGPGAGGDSSQTYIWELQSRLWNLMKENQELRDAMLRMRKKMLSLGAAASSGAGTRGLADPESLLHYLHPALP